LNAPQSLPIAITTLPIALVKPKPYFVETEKRAPRPTETEAAVKAEVEVKAEPGVAQIAAGAPSLIETPSWVRVTAGEDDQMEAREEMSAPNRSPSKRLRHGVVGSQVCSQAIRHRL